MQDGLGGPSGFADGEEAGFNFGGDNNGFDNNLPMRNDGFDFNTNRYQRGVGFVEDERLSLVNNPAGK